MPESCQQGDSEQSGNASTKTLRANRSADSEQGGSASENTLRLLDSISCHFTMDSSSHNRTVGDSGAFAYIYVVRDREGPVVCGDRLLCPGGVLIWSLRGRLLCALQFALRGLCCASCTLGIGVACLRCNPGCEGKAMSCSRDACISAGLAYVCAPVRVAVRRQDSRESQA